MSIAGYTYGELQEQVLAHQFSEIKYRPLVKAWLNEAQRRAVIESELRVEMSSEAISTEATKQTYALPTNFGRVIDLFNSESHELFDPLDVITFDHLPASSGRPYGYSVIGSNVTLYPTPDGVYPLTLRYWRLPNDMAAESDTPEIPVQYHELLVAYAMKKAFLREDDFQASQQWEAQWKEGLLKMRGEAQHDSFDGPKQVPGAWVDPHGAPYWSVWR